MQNIWLNINSFSLEIGGVMTTAESEFFTGNEEFCSEENEGAAAPNEAVVS
jgi:hypothetical protein